MVIPAPVARLIIFLDPRAKAYFVGSLPRTLETAPDVVAKRLFY